jgi:hypothetical protein
MNLIGSGEVSVAGSYERCDEPTGFGTTELVTGTNYSSVSHQIDNIYPGYTIAGRITFLEGSVPSCCVYSRVPL